MCATLSIYYNDPSIFHQDANNLRNNETITNFTQKLDIHAPLPKPQLKRSISSETNVTDSEILSEPSCPPTPIKNNRKVNSITTDLKSFPSEIQDSCLKNSGDIYNFFNIDDF